MAESAATKTGAPKSDHASRRTGVAVSSAGFGPGMHALTSMPPPSSNYAISHALSGGFALPDDLRSEFEYRFGADFSDVRLHAGPRAAAEADVLDANAFTLGNSIAFSASRYSPSTSSGKRLIAHELAHVVQQRRGGAMPELSSDAPHERSADTAAHAYATQTGAISVEGSTGVGIARDQKKRPATLKFLSERFQANRFNAWSKKIDDWPVDPKLKQLWSALGVAPSRDSGKGFAEEDKVLGRAEFKEFVEIVSDFQYQSLPNVDYSVEGIVDPATAIKLRKRLQLREERRRLEQTQQRREIQQTQRRRVIEKVSSIGSGAKPASQAKPTSWTDSLRSTASGALSTAKKAADDPRGMLNAVADKAEATLDSAVGTVKEAAADPVGTFDVAVDTAQDYISSITVGQVKDIFINLLFAQLGPRIGGSSTARKLLTAIAEGMGEQLYQEVIREKKGEKLLAQLKKITKDDLGELYKGYVIGAVEGLVSPVTDLYGLLVFGETMHNMMQDTMLKAIANIGKAGPEAKALLASVGTFATSLGEFMAKVRQNPSEVILAVLNASDVLEAKAIEKAKQLGREGGSAIVASFEEPWKAKKEVAAPDPLKSPLAYVQHQAKAGEDYLLDTPWAKIGSKAGYAVGFVVIQVLLLVFTSGIGNAITKASGAMAKVASALNGLGSRAAKAVGAATARVAELVKVLGNCISSIGTVIDTVLAKVIEKLPSIGKVLKPISDVMEKLKKFLQKLLGVAESKGPALIDNVAAKAAGELGDDAPKLAPRPPIQPPSANPPPKPNGGTAPTSSSGLELDTAGGHGWRGQSPKHNELDLGSSPGGTGPKLEVDTGQTWRGGPTNYGEVDLGPLPAGDLPKLYTGSKPVGRIPGVRRNEPTFGAASGERSGTHARTGMHFNELNPAEVAQGMRVNYDPIAGRPRSVRYRVDANTDARQVQTDRTFRRDPATEGAQATDADYTNTGMDRGHLGQREAFKGNADVEVAADQMPNVVPMHPDLNRGAGSPWRAAESRTMGYADRFGEVHVEVRPLYDANPQRLPNGMPIPSTVNRRVIAPDGAVLEDLTFNNAAGQAGNVTVNVAPTP